MKFQQLTIREWQQFQDISINFHENLTILTGANGSGKTTLLQLLARHSGWNIHSLATPKLDRNTGLIKYFQRFLGFEYDHTNMPEIGQLTYSNGVACSLTVPQGNAAQYQVQFSKLHAVQCLFVPSHRSIYRYQPVSQIPTAKKDRQSAFQEVSNSIRQRYLGGTEQPSSFFMKTTLIGWAIQGYGVRSENKVIMPTDAEQTRSYEGFQEVLRNVLPKSLGFDSFEIRNMEVVFVCNGGRDEFLLETASGGISALIDLAWQIYMFSTSKSEACTVMIDEVENHLHPIMQREVLPSLVAAFPQVSFVVSTHSPLVVNSVSDSAVYALRYNEERKIESRRLDFQNKARTAAEVLNEVLGVSSTLPVWAELRLNDLVEKYFSSSSSSFDLDGMRKELAEFGMERLMPNAIGRIEG